MTKTKLHFGDNFSYNPELGEDAFYQQFFDNPDSLLTISEIMQERLNAVEDKGPRHQVKRNSWWKTKSLSKSGLARYKNGFTNMMKVIPDLSVIGEELRDNSTKGFGGLIVSQDLIDIVDGFEFKRDNFSYHEQTEKSSINEILKDPILSGICADNPKVLEKYLEYLFEKGGVPPRREDGILNAHLTVDCDSGVSEPTICFYGLEFTGGLFSNSLFGHNISSVSGLTGLSKFPTICRK